MKPLLDFTLNLSDGLFQIVNGLVLASDGQKMSKRKKNYPDPLVVVNSYGADALRLYLINSPGRSNLLAAHILVL